jgi:hypothetical protein
VNVTAVHFKVAQQDLEISVVIKQGFALGIGDDNSKDAVVIVGLNGDAVVAKECELLAVFELSASYGFEM